MEVFYAPWCCHWRGAQYSLFLFPLTTIHIFSTNILQVSSICFRFIKVGWCLCLKYSINDVSVLQCDPYFDTNGCSHPGCEPAYPTPKCHRKCVDENQLWRDSKRFSVSAYRISSDPYDIMAEVYKNGPVEVSFTVYEVRTSSVSSLKIEKRWWVNLGLFQDYVLVLIRHTILWMLFHLLYK